MRDAMKQVYFTNNAPCPLQDKQPGATFLLTVLDDGETPTDIFWRKRIAEGVVFLTPQSPSEGVASDEAKTSKKGK